METFTSEDSDQDTYITDSEQEDEALPPELLQKHKHINNLLLQKNQKFQQNSKINIKNGNDAAIKDEQHITQQEIQDIQNTIKHQQTFTNTEHITLTKNTHLIERIIHHYCVLQQYNKLQTKT